MLAKMPNSNNKNDNNNNNFFIPVIKVQYGLFTQLFSCTVSPFCCKHTETTFRLTAVTNPQKASALLLSD